MTTMTAINMHAIDPDHLHDLSDRDFETVVGADLRRNAPNATASVPVTLTEALRHPSNAERWYDVLSRTLKSVEGQLASGADEFDARQAEIRKLIMAKEAALANAERTGTGNSIEQISRELLGLRLQMEDLRIEYKNRRAKKVRFKTGVDDATMEARTICNRHRDSIYESVVTKERNWYASRSERLQAGIISHFKATRAEDIEPNDFDLTLWALVGARPKP